MGATVSHALSMTTPNDPAYENQPQHWNSSHLFTLNAVGSEISNAFGNAGGVTFGYDGTNVTASAPGAAGQPVNFSAGTTSNNLGSVVFSNSNGISFGLNGSTITGTVATNYLTSQSNQAASANNGSFAFQTISFSNVNGVSFLTAAGSAIQASIATSLTNINVSAGTTSNNLSAFVLSNSNNVSFGLNGSTITATASVASSLTNINISAGTTSTNASAFTFSNSNNFTFGLGTGANAGVITASYTVPTVSGHGLGVSNTGNTAGNTGTQSTGTVVFAASGAITASQSTGAGISTVWYSVAAQSNQSAIKGLGVSNTGNTAGNTGLSTGIDWVLAASGAITASQSTAAGGPDTVWMSVATQTNQTVGLYAVGNTTQNSSTTLDARTISFDALGAASWGYSNGSVQVSVPATSSIVGTSGISVSTAGSTISVEPVLLSVFDPYPITTGSGTSSHAPASMWFSKMVLAWPVAVSYANVLKSLSVSAPGMSSQNSSVTNKFSYSHGLTLFTRQDFAGNSSNMSQWTTASFGLTATLSQSSSSASVAMSWVTNSTGGTTSFSTTSSSNNWTNFFTGMQMFRIPLVTTLTPGEYFVGQQQSSTTATVGSNFTLLSLSNFHIVPQSITFQTVTSSGSLAFSSPEGQGIGVASAVTTNNTMALSVVSAGTQNWWYMNFSNT